MDQHTEVERNDAKSVDGFLAPLAMQELERQGPVAGYVQPPVLLVDPEAGLVDMKGRARQKVFLGGGFPWFNLNSAVGARQSSGKLLMLNQCLCLENSTMANPFGEAL